MMRAGAWLFALSWIACGTTRAHEPSAEPPTLAPSSTAPTPRPADRPEPSGERAPRGPWTVELRVENAAFDAPRAPSAVAHASPGFDPARRPLPIVVFLHGWSGCARVLVHDGPTPCREGERPRDGWGLGARFDAASSGALFLVPQLAFLERDGSPGRFVEPGRFRAFLADVLGGLEPQLGPVGVDELAPLTLLAHSAGFATALALLSRGEVPVRHVVLFDALYRGVEPFGDWLAAAPERRLVSLYTGSARTATQSVRLAARARAMLPTGAVALDPPGPLSEAMRAHRLVVARSPAGHGSVPSRHLPEVLESLGLAEGR